MSEEVNPAPVPLTGPVLELAQVRAALAAGVPFEHAGRLRGATAEELEADAVQFVAQFVATAPQAPQTPRAGGPRGVDVGASGASGTLAAGVAAYREKHGLDEDGNPPPRKPLPTSDRNPYTQPTYTQEHR